MKMFDIDKNRMIGLPYGEKNHGDMLSRFHDTGTLRTDGQTDRQTDRLAISISRVSMLTRDKKIFHDFRKIPRKGIGHLLLQQGMVLKWFYSPRAVVTPLSEVHALYQVDFLLIRSVY